MTDEQIANLLATPGQDYSSKTISELVELSIDSTGKQLEWVMEAIQERVTPQQYINLRDIAFAKRQTGKAIPAHVC